MSIFRKPKKLVEVYTGWRRGRKSRHDGSYAAQAERLRRRLYPAGTRDRARERMGLDPKQVLHRVQER